LLGKLKYRRQVNRKTPGGSSNPDRDAQFEHINAAVIAKQAAGQPVISIDTKKKELIGPYKNGGSDHRPEGCPDKVNEHDFADKNLGKAVPYGVYDIAANAGCVSVGIDNDTAQFSVQAFASRCASASKRRGQFDPALVGCDGPRALSGHEPVDDHGRWWRFQRFTRAAVQG
jgi:hypothetical protein